MYTCKSKNVYTQIVYDFRIMERKRTCDEPDLEFHFSTQILQKLDEKHGVTIEEVYEAFDNSDGRTLIDTREKHKSNPPTEWFISQDSKRAIP